MKISIIFVLLFSSITVRSQDNVCVVLIANETAVNSQIPKLVSRLIISSKETFSYPEPPEIFLSSVISSFGCFETEVFDSSKKKFVPANIKVYQDKVPTYGARDSIVQTKLLNVRIPYLPVTAIDNGLYRTRVKIWFSRYNSNWPDLFSNWSYFYKG